jgi:hypothetical protein
MTLREWLDRRTPRPPERLCARIDAALVSAGSVNDVDIARALGDAAADILSTLAARSRPTLQADPTRESGLRDEALDLLAADALVTYAIEAAAENPVTFAATTDALIDQLVAASHVSHRPNDGPICQ